MGAEGSRRATPGAFDSSHYKAKIKRSKGGRMSEREVVLDQPQIDEQGQALRNAVERAERAEAELAKLKSGAKTVDNERKKRTESTLTTTEHVAEPGSLNRGQASAEKEP